MSAPNHSSEVAANPMGLQLLAMFVRARARTHKWPSHVRSRVNRTWSRHRRMSEAGPSLPSATALNARYAEQESARLFELLLLRDTPAASLPGDTRAFRSHPAFFDPNTSLSRIGLYYRLRRPKRLSMRVLLLSVVAAAGLGASVAAAGDVKVGQTKPAS